jgi:hypothetical protein
MTKAAYLNTRLGGGHIWPSAYFFSSATERISIKFRIGGGGRDLPRIEHSDPKSFKRLIQEMAASKGTAKTGTRLMKQQQYNRLLPGETRRFSRRQGISNLLAAVNFVSGSYIRK